MLVSPPRPTTVFEPPSLAALRPAAALARLWQFADLFITLSRHRVSVRYKQSRLGLAWAMLHPTAMMLVFTLMFGLLGAKSADGLPYAIFAFAGLLPWSAFSGGLSSATLSLTAHAHLLSRVAFPREILPLTYVVAALTDLGLGAVVLLGLMAWYGVALTIHAAWALAAVLVLALVLMGAGLLLSALQVRHRDVGLALPALLQLWMFATPVVYPLSLVRSRLPEPWLTLYLLNPLVGVIETFRRALLLAQPPDWHPLAMSVAVALVLLPAAYLYFKLCELTMADVV